MDSSTAALWIVHFPVAGFYYYYFFIKIPIADANSVDPDQMAHSVASDLGGRRSLSVTLLMVS